MSKRIIAFSAVNAELGTSLSPNNRCARKLDAVDNNGKDIYGNSFARNRLITDVEIENPTVYWTITFKKKVNGQVTDIETRQIADGDPITNVPQPSVSGYHFVGYSPSVPMYATQNATYVAIYSENEIPESSLRYFTTVAEGDGSISFHISNATDADPDHSTWGVVDEVSYRVWTGSTTPGGQKLYSSWTTVSNPKGQTIVVSDLHANDEVEWRGNASGYAVGYGPGAYSYFSSTCNMNIKNNPLTLLYNTDVDTIDDTSKMWEMDSRSSYCFCGLFEGCTTLTSAHKLYFPTTLKSGEHHFCDMFKDCTNLTVADFECSSGQMLDSCFERMFLGCTKLTQAPTLPSTLLGDSCYQAMFSGCTSLVNAPTLPATSLVYACYDAMFGEYEYSTYSTTYPGCSKLNNITMAAVCPASGVTPADWNRHKPNYNFGHPLKGWLVGAGTSASGCTIHGDTNWTTEHSQYFPSNWTITS